MTTARLDKPGRRYTAAGLRLSRMIVLAILPSALIGPLTPAARAGWIHPVVQEELSLLSPTMQATVLFILEQQAAISVLDQALKLEHATRGERHRRVLEALQAAAREGQPSLLHELNLRFQKGEVAGYLPAGEHTATWDGHDDAGRRLASGVYFARLRLDSASCTDRLVMIP